MRWLYYAVQLAVFLVAWYAFAVLAKADGVDIPPFGVLVLAAVAAVLATAVVYWSIRGIKRLLGYPAEGRVITPPGAFDNLRRRDSQPIEHQ